MKIDLETQNLPKFKLPIDQDLILLLIKNEILNTKVMNQLSNVGFDISRIGTELSSTILSLIGFTNRTDTLWEWYYNLLDSYTEKINIEEKHTIDKIVFEFYIKLQVKLHIEQEKAA